MELKALLLSQEQESTCLLREALDDLQVSSEVCLDRDHALDRLSHEKYDAIIVDCELDAAADLLKYSRLTGDNKNCISLAVVSSLRAMQDALDMGASFVLCKPLTAESVTRSLKAMRGLAYRLGRRSVRVTVQTLAFVNVDGQHEQGIILDISEGGMAIQALEPVEASRVLNFKFDLPGTKLPIDAFGEIAWADASGRAGIRFTEMDDASRQRLKDWLLVNLIRPSRITLPSHLVVKDDPAARDWAANIRVGPVADAEHPAILALAGENTAERLFGSLLDWTVVLSATIAFTALVYRFIGELPQSRWAMPFGLVVPCLFWLLYHYIFMGEPAGTPGAQVARYASPRVAGIGRNRRIAAAVEWGAGAFRRRVGEVQEELEATTVAATAEQRMALGQITINPIR